MLFPTFVIICKKSSQAFSIRIQAKQIVVPFESGVRSNGRLSSVFAVLGKIALTPTALAGDSPMPDFKEQRLKSARL
jgi:hypothetical protein